MTTRTLQRIRDLIDPAALTDDSQQSAGYIDLLPPPPDRPHRAAQKAMNNQLVVAVYGAGWRSFSALINTGMTKTAERHRAVKALRLSGSDRLLDVACGPGNFTSHLGKDLDSDGLAIGFDLSVPMLNRAARINSGPRVGYVRGDARNLAFNDGTFDAVSCFAALFLMPDPFKILEEMIRVLAPGGHLAVMTSCVRGPRPIRWISTKIAGLSGVYGFERSDITAILDGAGFHNIEQEVRGVSQFVSATKA